MWKVKVKALLKYDEIGLFRGLDIFGNRKVDYLKKITTLTLSDLSQESAKMIRRWYMTKKQEYYWRMNACYFECLRRGKHNMFHRRHRYLLYDPKIKLRRKLDNF